MDRIVKDVKLSDGKEVQVKEIRTKESRYILKKLPSLKLDLESLQKDIANNKVVGMAVALGTGLDLLVEFSEQLTSLKKDEIDNLPQKDSVLLLQEVIEVNKDFFSTLDLSVTSQTQDQAQEKISTTQDTPVLTQS